MYRKKRMIVPVILIFFLLLAALGYGGWRWYDSHVDRSGWVEKDGVRFYQDFHAQPVSGWLALTEGRYYLHEDGTPYLGWQDIGGVTYYFGSDGKMTTGWMEQRGKTYYFDTSGAMVSGWLQEGENRYYLMSGVLRTGWQEIEGSTYHFDRDGVMTLGLAELDGSRYYFGDDGIMVTGPVALEDGFYRFGEDGAMVTGWVDTEEGRRYYLPEGPMAVGWLELDGNRYFFLDDGLMYTGWLQIGEYSYYLREDGTAAVGPTVIDGQTHYFSPKGIEVILVNGLNPVPDYYEMDLVNVVDYHDVDSRCYDALMQMLADCNAAGIEYVFNSAYRTLAEQTAILGLRTQEHMEEFGLEFTEAREKALETVAVPGTSEHHLGLAVDLLGDEAIPWFREHCWDYGFIVRYTEEKESITGIVDEPWHFRYVGKEVSLDMKDSGLCLEEYLGAEAVTWEKVQAFHGDKLYEEIDLEELLPAD